MFLPDLTNRTLESGERLLAAERLIIAGVPNVSTHHLRNESKNRKETRSALLTTHNSLGSFEANDTCRSSPMNNELLQNLNNTLNLN